MIILIEIIGIMFEFAGMVLNANKNKYCWPLWMVGDILFLIAAIFIADTMFILIWCMFIINNFYGWYKWKNSKI
jgi:hypothetical protein